MSTCADLAQANNGTDASACIDAIAAVASGISPEDIVTAATKLLGGADSGSGLGDLLGARQSSDKSDEVKKGLEKATDIIGKIVKGKLSPSSVSLPTSLETILILWNYRGIFASF